MKYYSTRDAAQRLFPLKEAAIMGLAPDGGLFMPEHIPAVDMDEVKRLGDSSFPQMAAYLASLFFDEFTKDELLEITRSAFDFDIPLNNIGGKLYTLELFHGPTFAFKDVGARFMGHMLGRLTGSGEKVNVLVATSGDTGSAVAQGFYGVDGVDVTILFPHGKVSPFQESQMTTLGKNIHPVSVNGCFDDCQRMVKELLADKEFHTAHKLTSANSINLLRWIPQSFYYFWGWCQWVKANPGKEPVIAVPSGNFGNIAAGMLAKKMGLPIKHFIAVSNANDTIPRYLQEGNYAPNPTVATLANAMDVSAPSNYERIMNLYNGSLEGLRAEVTGFACSDTLIKAGIAEEYEKYGYLSCPHSTTGYLLASMTRMEGFWLSTAHYAKFIGVISDALGKVMPLIEPFATISTRKGHSTNIDPDTNQLRKLF